MKFALICCGWSLFLAPFTQAALSLSEIEFWVNGPPGTTDQEAALVIDWDDGSSPLTWGYHWPEGESRTGQDLIFAVALADPRLSIDGIESGFLSNFGFDANLDGRPENFRPGWDGVANFWNYFVNNEVFTHPTDFSLNGHVIPLATDVQPLGTPYEDGRWIVSSTGIAGRPLVDGSWDGFLYGDGSKNPAESVSATVPVPEPGSSLFVLVGILMLLSTRKAPAIQS